MKRTSTALSMLGYSFLLFAVFLPAAAQPTSTQPSPASLSSDQPRFEVASVRMVDSKPHPLEDLVKGIGLTSASTYPTNHFFAHNMNLKNLICIAYGANDKYFQGDPAWLDSQNYDIEAKVEGDEQLTYQQLKPLLQNLLEQRFHLALHREKKSIAGYALVIAKGGPKLHASESTGSGHAYILPSGIEARGRDMQDFTSLVSRPVGSPVVDKTGLTGTYDINLSYAPANDPASSLPSIFTALQEQLGLKLESQKIPVDFLIIDHVERTPTAN